uniref:Uncharacterized protein n=1 Tax=Podoviridae sp. ctG4L18 TaxID=2825234 RepID=A0A8S5UP44_9CAUD|nr:MAG TPA: hypothetical protein [Podoviridae sp. ctG4L18]
MLDGYQVNISSSIYLDMLQLLVNNSVSSAYQSELLLIMIKQG